MARTTRTVLKPNRKRNRSAQAALPAMFELLESRQLMSATGILDPAFGVGGVAKTGFISTDVAVDSVGRTVIAGEIGSDFAVMRLRANGSIDTTFGNQGVAQTDFGGLRRATRAPAIAQP